MKCSKYISESESFLDSTKASLLKFNTYSNRKKLIIVTFDMVKMFTQCSFT